MTEKPILFSGPMVRAILASQKTQTRRVVSDPRNMIQKIGGSGDADNDPDAFGYFAEGRGFSGWMVLARGVNERVGNNQDRCSIPCPYDADRLWVRETWRTATRNGVNGVVYAADGAFIPIADTREAADAWVDAHENGKHGLRWRPSIFLRRWACRLVLAVESIRVERLHDITEEDARAEGVERSSCAQHFAADPDRDYGWENYLWHGRPEASRSLVDAWPHQFSNYSASSGGARGSFSSLWQSINGKRPGCSWDENPWVWRVEFSRVTP